MKRHPVVKVQLVVLAGLALLVMYRVAKGPPPPDGLVVLTDLHARHLERAAFELDGAADIAVRATGSVVSEGRAHDLAAWAWIVRRDGRGVVWQMDAENVERPRGTLAVVPGDTFALDAGAYDVFFAAFGDRGPWSGDANRWLLVLDVVDDAVAARRLEVADVTANPRLVWKAAPLEDDEEREVLFEILHPTALHLYAAGEIGPGPDGNREDWSWIEDVVNDNVVWALAEDNSGPAGGFRGNRLFDGRLHVVPGIYRAAAKTDGHHAYGDWRDAPPWDPAAWGLTIEAEDRSAVRIFDPWSSLDQLIGLTGVGDDEILTQRFEVTESLPIAIHALGEITSRNGVYDFAELLAEGPGRTRQVWKMSWDGSVHAGGDHKNRQETVIRTLEPGTYTLRYESDGSHSADGWNADEPDHPGRWGVTIFPLRGAVADAGIRIQEGGRVIRAAARDGKVIVDWAGIEGDILERHAFTLEEPTRLHVTSIGEMTASTRYDYGYVLRVDDGETVWTMTYDNTEHAGGSDSNRRFNDVVDFAPGEYMAYFKTDGSHHVGDFGDDGPDRPEEWGMTIRFAE